MSDKPVLKLANMAQAQALRAVLLEMPMQEEVYRRAFPAPHDLEQFIEAVAEVSGISRAGLREHLRARPH